MHVSWPLWTADAATSMVAADRLEECGYTDLARPTLAKLFPGATDADLDAMMESPQPGEMIFANMNVQPAFVDVPRWTSTERVPLSQAATDGAVHYELTRMTALDLDARRRLDQAYGLATGPSTVFHDNRNHSVRFQVGGRHSSPVIRAWHARLEAARRADNGLLAGVSYEEANAQVTQLVRDLRAYGTATVRTDADGNVFVRNALAKPYSDDL